MSHYNVNIGNIFRARGAACKYQDGIDRFREGVGWKLNHGR